MLTLLFLSRMCVCHPYGFGQWSPHSLLMGIARLCPWALESLDYGCLSHIIMEGPSTDHVLWLHWLAITWSWIKKSICRMFFKLKRDLQGIAQFIVIASYWTASIAAILLNCMKAASLLNIQQISYDLNIWKVLEHFYHLWPPVMCFWPHYLTHYLMPYLMTIFRLWVNACQSEPPCCSLQSEKGWNCCILCFPNVQRTGTIYQKESD